MMIRYSYEFHATRVTVNVFKGSFVVFIGRDPKPDKENHDLMFSINMFMIDYKHQTTPVTEVFLNFFGLTDLKAVISIEFINFERDRNESRQNSFIKAVKTARNSSLPAILPEDAYENWSKTDKSNSGQQNPIKSSRNCKRLGKNDDEYSLKVDERLILLFFYFKISRANKKKTKEKL